MKYKAVVFDLDGTLLDTLEDLATSGNTILAELGFPTHPVEAYKYFVGNGLSVLVERILPEGEHSRDFIEETVARFRNDYAERWHHTSGMYPGIGSMLDELTRRGVMLSILSNKPNPFTLKCVDRFFKGYQFEAVFGERAGVPKKPSPAGAVEIVEKFQIPKENIIYVGDSSVDMKTAKAAGLDSVGVLWGFRGEKELRDSGADYIIEHPEELIAIVESGRD